MRESYILARMAFQEIEDRFLAGEVKLYLHLFYPNEWKKLHNMGAKLRIENGKIELTSVGDGHTNKEVLKILRSVGIIMEKPRHR